MGGFHAARYILKTTSRQGPVSDPAQDLGPLCRNPRFRLLLNGLAQHPHQPKRMHRTFK